MRKLFIIMIILMLATLLGCSNSDITGNNEENKPSTSQENSKSNAEAMFENFLFDIYSSSDKEGNIEQFTEEIDGKFVSVCDWRWRQYDSKNFERIMSNMDLSEYEARYITQVDEDSYEVEGTIIMAMSSKTEITSNEKARILSWSNISIPLIKDKVKVKNANTLLIIYSTSVLTKIVHKLINILSIIGIIGIVIAILKAMF